MNTNKKRRSHFIKNNKINQKLPINISDNFIDYYSGYSSNYSTEIERKLYNVYDDNSSCERMGYGRNLILESNLKDS